MAQATAESKPAPVAQRLRTEVDRLMQRGLKGIEYLGSPAPVVGTDAEDAAAPPRHAGPVPLQADSSARSTACRSCW